MKKSSGLDYSKSVINADGSISTPYITNQNNPAIKAYVKAVQKGMPKDYVFPKLSTLESEAVAPSYPHEKLLQALYFAWDLFERSQMPMFLIGPTAASVLQKKDLDGDTIYIGVRQNAWNGGAKRTLDSVAMPQEEKSHRAMYLFDGVRIIVTVFPDTECILSPDQVVYHQEVFYLPNTYRKFMDTYGRDAWK